MSVDVEGAAERLDELNGKLGEDVVTAAKAAAASLDVPAGTSITDATVRITKVLPKLPAGKRKLLLSAFMQRDADGEVVVDSKGRPEPDPDLRVQESIPLVQSVTDYIAREVMPHAPDAWVDDTKTVVGYEIPLTRYFYKYFEPRPLDEIDAEIDEVEQEILRLLAEVRE